MTLIEELLGPQPEWARQGACTLPSVHPAIIAGLNADVARARRISRRYPVLAQCDAWALDDGAPGKI